MINIKAFYIRVTTDEKLLPVEERNDIWEAVVDASMAYQNDIAERIYEDTGSHTLTALLLNEMVGLPLGKEKEAMKEAMRRFKDLVRDADDFRKGLVNSIVQASREEGEALKPEDVDVNDLQESYDEFLEEIASKMDVDELGLWESVKLDIEHGDLHIEDIEKTWNDISWYQKQINRHVSNFDQMYDFGESCQEVFQDYLKIDISNNPKMELIKYLTGSGK